MEEGLEGTKLQLLASPCCLRSKGNSGVSEGNRIQDLEKSQPVTFASRDRDRDVEN